jgi:hypothetical protein
MAQNISNGHKIAQMALQYNNIFHFKILQNLSKLGFLVREFLVRKYTIWQPCKVSFEFFAIQIAVANSPLKKDIWKKKLF